jgi:glycosyltransferase involved in cell wall biosynthesis
VERIAVLCPQSHSQVDGIRDYSRLLVDALRSAGGISAGLLHDFRALSTNVRHDAIILQYNPFLYGRWGIAPELPMAMARLRTMRHRPIIAVLVHELFVPMTSWRSTVMGAAQRVQFAAVRRIADLLFSSIEAWARRLGGETSRPPCFHLPVASMLPDRRSSRPAERERLGIDADVVVLAAFGTGHPSQLSAHVVAAANAVARTGRRVVLLNLGVGAPHLDDLRPEITVHTPGLLPVDALARRLSSADLFLAPFSDGVSTRRTTTMAALQHGLPVIGTDGRLTDSVLRDAGALRLVPADRTQDFAAAAADLAARRADRQALAAAGRALYVQSFDWPVLVAKLLGRLGLEPEGAPATPLTLSKAETHPL